MLSLLSSAFSEQHQQFDDRKEMKTVYLIAITVRGNFKASDWELSNPDVEDVLIYASVQRPHYRLLSAGEFVNAVVQDKPKRNGAELVWVSIVSLICQTQIAIGLCKPFNHWVVPACKCAIV